MNGDSLQVDGCYLPARIVSGGQTGVDRAALDVAIALGIEHGGWCPAGRLSEDGTVPSRYQLRETESRDYPIRTEQNVLDSDATLLLCNGKIKGGTALTKRLCVRHHQPHLVVQIDLWNVGPFRTWLDQQRPETLNIAGPRESTSPGIYDQTLQFLFKAWSHTPIK